MGPGGPPQNAAATFPCDVPRGGPRGPRTLAVARTYATHLAPTSGATL